MPFIDIGRALVAIFQSALSDQEITTQLIAERNQPGETCREHADRMVVIADLIDGGSSLPAKATSALPTSQRHTWAKYTYHLRNVANKQSDNPLAELSFAMHHLTFLAKSNVK